MKKVFVKKNPPGGGPICLFQFFIGDTMMFIFFFICKLVLEPESFAIFFNKRKTIPLSIMFLVQKVNNLSYGQIKHIISPLYLVYYTKF